MRPPVIRAAQIVAEREYQYRMVIADRYVMALLGGDGEMSQPIWQEAWLEFDGPLLALLVFSRY